MHMYGRVERGPFLGSRKGIWLFFRYTNALTSFMSWHLLAWATQVCSHGDITVAYLCWHDSYVDQSVLDGFITVMSSFGFAQISEVGAHFFIRNTEERFCLIFES